MQNLTIDIFDGNVNAIFCLKTSAFHMKFPVEDLRHGASLARMVTLKTRETIKKELSAETDVKPDELKQATAAMLPRLRTWVENNGARMAFPQHV